MRKRIKILFPNLFFKNRSPRAIHHVISTILVVKLSILFSRFGLPYKLVKPQGVTSYTIIKLSLIQRCYFVDDSATI